MDVVDALDRRRRTITSYCASRHVRLLLLRKASALDLAFCDDPESSDQMDNAMQQERIYVLALQSTTWLRTMLQLVGKATLLWVLHRLAPVVMLLVALPEAAVAGAAIRATHQVRTSHAADRRMAEYISELLTSRAAAMETRVFGLQSTLLDPFAQCTGRLLDDTRHAEDIRTRGLAGVSPLAAAGAAAVGAYVIHRALQGGITVGDVTMYLGAALGVWSSAELLLRSGASAYGSSLFVDDLSAFLDLDGTRTEEALATRAEGDGSQAAGPSSLPHGIELRDVSFRYPKSERVAMRGANLRIAAGETVAIVGCNGAGKTTLVKLLCRLHDPSEGEVFLDGVALPRHDLPDVRRHLSIIFQDFVRYSFTVAENVGFGDVEHLGDRPRLAAAADKAGAAEMILGLPRSWDNPLGRDFPDGVELSTGQWQMIALARAFMRDARVQVLDEPTASLDAVAEQEVFSRFSELTRGRTPILISHRSSTDRMADRIIVLDRGRVAEQGSHRELLGLGGLYATMHHAQGERYVDGAQPGIEDSAQPKD